METESFNDALSVVAAHETAPFTLNQRETIPMSQSLYSLPLPKGLKGTVAMPLKTVTGTKLPGYIYIQWGSWKLSYTAQILPEINA